MTRQHTCYFIEDACPKCGAPIATDGKDIWCSNGEPTCDYYLKNGANPEHLEFVPDNNFNPNEL